MEFGAIFWYNGSAYKGRKERVRHESRENGVDSVAASGRHHPAAESVERPSGHSEIRNLGTIWDEVEKERDLL